MGFSMVSDSDQPYISSVQLVELCKVVASNEGGLSTSWRRSVNHIPKKRVSQAIWGDSPQRERPTQ